MPVGNFNNVNRTYYKARKEDGKFITKGDENVYDYLRGYLTKIELSEYEYKGDIHPTIKFYFKDKTGDNLDILEMGRYRLMARDIINSLANIKEIGWVQITPYTTADEKGNDYVHASLRAGTNLDKVEKKFKSEDIPSAKEIIINKKKQFDNTERDKFFENLINEIKGRLIDSDFQDSINADSENEDVPF